MISKNYCSFAIDLNFNMENDIIKINNNKNKFIYLFTMLFLLIIYVVSYSISMYGSFDGENLILGIIHIGMFISLNVVNIVVICIFVFNNIYKKINKIKLDFNPNMIDTSNVVDNLTNINKKINSLSSEEFNEDNLNNILEVSINNYELFAKAIKILINKNVIDYKDLSTKNIDDEIVIRKFENGEMEKKKSKVVKIKKNDLLFTFWFNYNEIIILP